MNQTDYYVKLNTKSTVTNDILEKIKKATPDQWSIVHDQSVLKLSMDDFRGDPAIMQAIIDLNCYEKLSVLRLNRNECYQWHTDMIREGALNMLLTGFDSFCAFGTLSSNRKFINLDKLTHEPNTYYLINVKKFHTVFNFSKLRYIVSIGIPSKTHAESCAYLKEKNLLC